MNRYSKLTIMLVALGGLWTAASATPIGPVYPPPGGVSFSGTGSAGSSGGRTNNYTALDTSAYDDLYWGLASFEAVQAGLNGSLDRLGFEYFSGNTATFIRTSLWQDADPGGPTPGVGSMVAVNLKFQITLTGASFVSASSVGLDPSLGAVAQINGSAFSANLQFLADYGNGWIALNDVPQFSSGLTRSSFSGGFYYTPVSQVPETGGTIGLLALATVALAGLRRRFRTG